MTTTTQTYPNQVRFNWGYHNGASDIRNNRQEKYTSGHFDQTYLVGYRQGLVDARNGNYYDNSQFAWDMAIFWGDVEK